MDAGLPGTGRRSGTLAMAGMVIAIGGLAALAIVRGHRPATTAPPNHRVDLAPPALASATAAPAKALGLALASRRLEPSYQDIEGVVERYREDPVAQEFAEAYQESSQLRHLWEQFKRTRDSREFLSELGRSEEFRRVLEDFATDRGYQRLRVELARSPGLDVALRRIEEAPGILRFASGSDAAARDPVASADRTATPSARPVRPVAALRRAKAVAASPPVRSRPGALRPGDAPAGVSGRSDVGAPRATTGQPGEPSALVSTLPERIVGYNPKGREAQGVQTRLKRVGDAGPAREVGREFLSLCRSGVAGISVPDCSAIGAYLGDYDLWGACFLAGSYEKCALACGSKPELQCGSVDFFAACRNAGQTEQRCRELCAGRSDCGQDGAPAACAVTRCEAAEPECGQASRGTDNCGNPCQRTKTCECRCTVSRDNGNCSGWFSPGSISMGTCSNGVATFSAPGGPGGCSSITAHCITSGTPYQNCGTYLTLHPQCAPVSP